MRIFYFTTPDPKLQGDIQENVILIGLRELLGENVIDYPRKKVLYGEFDETPKETIHGRGFTLYNKPIQDIANRPDPSTITPNDIILYGVCNDYGVTDYPEYNKLTPNVFYLDGHDNEKIRKTPCFKREYYEETQNVWGTGFGIPEHLIRPIDFNKNQLYQSTAPLYCFDNANNPNLLKAGLNYKFTNEKDYFDDMSKSWFGLSCKKGGWDALRHYEIMAAGSVLVYKDYNKKPILCSPVGIPAVVYSNTDELFQLMNFLVPNNQPSKLYKRILFEQRDWLLKFGTCKIRALKVLQEINLQIK